MRINHNIAALNTYRQLTVNNEASSKAIEKLSSGLRINRAGDDAAGLAISEKMRGQIRGLEMASKNAQDGISLIQTAEGALSETHAILQRMRELTVQSLNDTNEAEDRGALNEEFMALIAEIDRIADTTQFNGKVLLNGELGGGKLDEDSVEDLAAAGVAGVSVSGAAEGEYGLNLSDTTLTVTFTAEGEDDPTTTITIADVKAPEGFGVATIELADLGVVLRINSSFADDTDVTFTVESGSELSLQIGANENQTIEIAINNMDAGALGVATTSIADKDGANEALVALDGAIKAVSTQRSALGAYQNRLEHTISNVDTAAENLTAAESRIRDVDMAREIMEFTKTAILTQAAQAMLAQANQQPQGVLQLLR
ncbi:MAG: flagellin [Bacillota bacterium]|nr:flagellin [Bacillota bacterium]